MTPCDQTHLKACLSAVLSEFADRIRTTLAWIGSRVEFHQSQVYELTGSLSFFRLTEPDTELIVISVQLRGGSIPRWEVDAIDRRSVIFAELDKLSDDESVTMAYDSTAAGDIVATFLEHHLSVIQNLLRSYE